MPVERTATPQTRGADAKPATPAREPRLEQSVKWLGYFVPGFFDY